MSNATQTAVTLATIAWIGVVCVASEGDRAPGAPAGIAAPVTPAAPANQAWLGVFVGDAIDGGVRLVAVVPGGPAQKAGLQPGDLLIRLDGKAVPDREAIDALVRRLKPGNRVAAEILRQGRPETRWLEAVDRIGPAWRQLVPGPAHADAHGDLGAALDATLVAIPDALRVHYGAPADRGALVTGVGGAGPAAAAGLRVGDVIVAVDGAPVRDPRDERWTTVGVPRRIELVRSGRQREIAVPDAAAPEERAEAGVTLRAEIDRLLARVKELERQLELERSRQMR